MLSSRVLGRAFVAGLALLALAGCAQFPKQMLGRFEAERDFIIIDKGGWIFWSSKSELDQPPHQVGIGTVDDETPLHVHVVVHSASSFWPKLDFSPDYERVAVDWGEVYWNGDTGGRAGKRSTEYVRSRPQNDLIARFQAEPMFWKQLDIADEVAPQLTPKDLAPLQPLLADDNRHTRGNVAYLFAKVGDPRGFDAIVATLSDYSAREVRLQMGNYVRPEVRATPQALARQISEDRYFAVHLLGRLRDPRALDVLIPMLDRDDVNYNAAVALGMIGDARAVPPLISALSHEDAQVRTSAIWSLEKLHATQALPALEALFDDHALPRAGERVSVGIQAQRAAESIQRGSR